MCQNDQQEKILAWARYLYWADLSRRHFDDYAEESRLPDKWQDWWRFFALLSHWYAAEYVVIEGWREARLQDQVIDTVLVRWADVVSMLRRYRKGVYHYQPNLIEPRFMPILEDSERTMFLVYYLHSEFLRYYWSYVNDFPGTPDQCSEFRDHVLAIVGWIPEDIIEARTTRLQRLVAAAKEFTDGDMSIAADELREVAKNARFVAVEQLERFRQQCRSFLSKDES